MNRFYYLKDNKLNNKSLEELMCIKIKLSHLSVIPYLETLSKSFVPHNQIFDARAIIMQCNGICKRIFLC